MYEHAEKKVIYIAHPRTASSATGHILLKMGFKILGDHHQVIPERITGEHLVFSTVRHPLDVFVSWYHNKKREQNSFKEWLPIFIHDCHYISNGLFYGQKYCTHVIHFETLQDDFDAVCNDAGFRPRTIPHRNVSKGRRSDYLSYYDNELLELVLKRFRDDFVENEYPIPQRLT